MLDKENCIPDILGTLFWARPEKHDPCIRKHNPASPTCLWHCWVVVWWTGVDISGWICQNDSDKLVCTATTHISIHSLVICPSIEFAKFPIIRPPVNIRIVLHEYHHPACSKRFLFFFFLPHILSKLLKAAQTTSFLFFLLASSTFVWKADKWMFRA